MTIKFTIADYHGASAEWYLKLPANDLLNSILQIGFTPHNWRVNKNKVMILKTVNLLVFIWKFILFEM